MPRFRILAGGDKGGPVRAPTAPQFGLAPYGFRMSWRALSPSSATDLPGQPKALRILIPFLKD